MEQGRNEHNDGFNSFASAQYYENLAREQYVGKETKYALLDASKDRLNPQLNVALVQKRLSDLEHYKYRFGADHRYWVHAALRRQWTYLNRYKFNLAFKAFLVYQVLRSVQHFRYRNQVQLLSTSEQAVLMGPIAVSSGALAGACLLI